MSYFMSAVERDALSYKDHGRTACPSVLDGDEARLFSTTLRHRHQGTHPFLYDGGLVEHCYLEAISLSELPGAFRDVARSADIAWEHLNTPGEGLPGTDGLTGPVTLDQLGRTVACQYLHPLQHRLLVLGWLLHLGVLPSPLVQTLRDGLANVGGHDLTSDLGREIEGSSSDSERPSALGCDGGGPADGTAIDLVRRTEANEQNSRRWARGVKHCHLVPLAAEITRREHPRDGTAGLLVHPGERRRQRTPRECERQERGLMTGRRGGDDRGLKRHR
jgi:hypothetical protein